MKLQLATVSLAELKLRVLHQQQEILGVELSCVRFGFVHVLNKHDVFCILVMFRSINQLLAVKGQQHAGRRQSCR